MISQPRPTAYIVLLFALFLGVGAPRVFARDGALDPAFGSGGRVALAADSSLTSVAAQPDGKFVAVGTIASGSGQTLRLFRFNADGSADASFGIGGRVVVPNAISSAGEVVVQPDGKIIVGAITADSPQYPLLVTRFTPDGGLDVGYGDRGQFTFYAGVGVGSLVLQPSGKLVIAGYRQATSSLTLLRFDANGNFDSSFGSGGRAEMPVASGTAGVRAAAQPDGRIVAGGTVFGANYTMTVGRFTVDGQPDQTFGSAGRVLLNYGTSDEFHDLAVDPAGGIAVVGGAYRPNATGYDFAVARLRPDGSPDPYFGAGGRTLVDIDEGSDDTAQRVLAQADGKLLVFGRRLVQIGDQPRIAAVRLDQKGVPDRSFNADGKALEYRSFESDVRAAVMLPGGKPLVLGWGFYDAGGNNLQTRSSLLLYAPGHAASEYDTAGDFDGDGRTDVAIFRDSDGTWWVRRSSDGVVTAVRFGSPGDRPVAADYDGDGLADYAVYRPSTGVWYYLRSTDGGFGAVRFGVASDSPAPADYDGDGRADIAVYRPSEGNWYILQSGTGGFSVARFGVSSDVPAPADYDGDGRADIAVYRPAAPGGALAEWWIRRSSDGAAESRPFGGPGDAPVPADYNGDGRAEIAIWSRTYNVWNYVLTNDSWGSFNFPAPADEVLRGDFDADGKADFGFRRVSDGAWRIYMSRRGLALHYFGLAGDVAVPGWPR